MRLSIDHQTRYAYDRPAAGIVQALRLTPRAHDGLQLLRWRVDIDADGWLKPARDAHGNRCHLFYAAAPVQRLTLTVAGEALTRDTAGVLGPDEGAPLPLYRRATPLTLADAAVAAFARDVAAGEATTLGRCHALMRAVNARMRFLPGASHAATPAAAAFAAGAGVCQDLTQVFVAAARSIGIAARYAQGHYAPPGHPEQEAAHAWAEAWVEDLGWVGFDCTHGVCPGEHHLRVAVGFDALDAAPVRGARRGGGTERLEVAVQGHALPPTRRQSQSQSQSQSGGGAQRQSQSQS